MNHQPTDEALLQLIVERNPEAYTQLYHRHGQTAYNLIYRIVRDAQVADDMLQETFWLVWQKAAQFDGRGSVAAWLFRIARNKSLDELRHQKTLPPLIDQHDSHENILAALEAPSGEVEQAVEQNWLQHHVREALRHIPEEQRQCLDLAYFGGLSQRKIAEQTNIPVGTVKTRIRLAMEKLARSLRGAGLRFENDER
jgi:RNA polymerase sigma-70 factor (ECF subfamily)